MTLLETVSVYRARAVKKSRRKPSKKLDWGREECAATKGQTLLLFLLMRKYSISKNSSMERNM